MSIIDILSGRIVYFNSIAVPTHNAIGSKIKALQDGSEKIVLALILDLIASKGIDILFAPDDGLVLHKVKDFNAGDIKRLYTLFMIWSGFDVVTLEIFKEQEFMQKLKNVLEMSDAEFRQVSAKLKHSSPSEMDKLWTEICKIIKEDPDNTKHALTFRTAFSRISKEAFNELENLGAKLS